KKKAWMRDHQLARRNLTPTEWNYYYGLKFNEEKKPEGNPQLRQNGGVEPPGATADRLAAESGKSPRSVERAGQFAGAVQAQPPTSHPALMAGAVPAAPVLAAAEQNKPLFCDRCTRVGPSPGCKNCANRRASIEKSKKRTKPRGPKKGEVLYDWSNLQA